MDAGTDQELSMPAIRIAALTKAVSRRTIHYRHAMPVHAFHNRPVASAHVANLTSSRPRPRPHDSAPTVGCARYSAS